MNADDTGHNTKDLISIARSKWSKLLSMNKRTERILNATIRNFNMNQPVDLAPGRFHWDFKAISDLH